MATVSATITSAAGETAYVACPSGRATIAVTGTISAGAILLVWRPDQLASDFVADTIDAVTLATNSNEAGTGWSWVQPIRLSVNAQVALKANAAFSGNVTAAIAADPF